MHNHKHDHCSHDLKHCTCCDVVYCTRCNKEWGKEKIVYSGHPWTWTYATPLATKDFTVTCGGGTTCLTTADWNKPMYVSGNTSVSNGECNAFNTCNHKINGGSSN